MIELFYSTSPNVYKVMIGLEEMRLDYELVLVDLSKGEQFDPSRLGGSIAAKVPVLRDTAPAWGGEPVTIIESGAILQYLAEKTGKLLPSVPALRSEALQWLFWQMAHLGPIGGQFWHFTSFAPRIEPQTDFAYPQRRYTRMMAALWDVLEHRLGDRDYIAGDYSIADVACYPWVNYLLSYFDQPYPRLLRWKEAIASRPAVVRSFERNAAFQTGYQRNERGGIAYPFDGLKQHTIVA